MRVVLLGFIVTALTATGGGAPLRFRPAATSVGPPVIGLRVVADGKAPVRVWVPNGGRATVGVTGKPTLGLTPHLADRWVDLVIVEVADDGGGGGEVVAELGRLRLERDVVVRFEGAATRLDITWIDLRQGREPSDMPMGPCTTCCVVCDGQKACACVVLTECGSCCCPNACLCEFTTKAQTSGGAGDVRMSGCPAPAGANAARARR